MEILTNRDMLIATLKGKLDDYGAEEANIYYHIACPYHAGDNRAKCRGRTITTRNVCTECKVLWLDQRVDE